MRRRRIVGIAAAAAAGILALTAAVLPAVLTMLRLSHGYPGSATVRYP